MLAATQIHVLNNPTTVQGEAYLLARLLTRLVPRMAWYEAMMDPVQFHGWFLLLSSSTFLPGTEHT